MRSESQNSAEEENHRYSTASVVEEYLYAAPTKYVNAGKTTNFLASKHLRHFIATVTKYLEPSTKNNLLWQQQFFCIINFV